MTKSLTGLLALIAGFALSHQAQAAKLNGYPPTAKTTAFFQAAPIKNFSETSADFFIALTNQPALYSFPKRKEFETTTRDFLLEHVKNKKTVEIQFDPRNNQIQTLGDADFSSKALANSFSDAKDPKTIAISVISVDRVKTLFQSLAQNQTIPFRFPLDGCEERATAMALLAEAEGIMVGKVFVEGELRVRTSNPLYPTAGWRHHVAPVIYVQQVVGPATLMVLDPSLFDKPVSVKELKTRLLTNIGGEKPYIDEVYYGPRFQIYSRYAELYKTQWDLDHLEDVRKTLKEYLPFQDDSTHAPRRREYRQGALPKATGAGGKRIPSGKRTKPLPNQ